MTQQEGKLMLGLEFLFKKTGLYVIFLALKLTTDVQIYRGTDFVADTVGHTALERPLIVKGHADYGESGVSIAELYVPAGCHLMVALQPNIRQGRATGHRAHENCCVIELHQVGCSCLQGHVGNRHCREENNKLLVKVC